MRMYEKILLSAVVVGYGGMLIADDLDFYWVGWVMALLWMVPIGCGVAFVGVDLIDGMAKSIVERDQNIKRIADSADAALIELRRGKHGEG